MSWRSRWWWAAALTAALAGSAYVLSLREGALFLGIDAAYAFCPGWEAAMGAGVARWTVVDWVPLLRYAGLPGVVVAFLTHWICVRVRRPRAGTVVARVQAALMLVVYGTAPLAFAVDVSIDRDCLGMWSATGDPTFFLDTDIAPTLAALCVLAAVRTPRHRIRRLAASRRLRRGTAGLAALGLLTLLPAADLTKGPIAPLEECPVNDWTKVAMGERAFLCGARAGGQFAGVSDHDLLAYGRAGCRAYRGRVSDAYLIAPICPRAAADVQAKLDAEGADFRAEEVRNQRVCDASRHRPRITPVRVVRDRTWTDYGVLESYEYDESTARLPGEDDLLGAAQKNGLVAAGPGHLIILSHSDFDICLTVETYRRRPPLELKGWDHVVEVGYESTTGQVRLMDPMVGQDDLPNLAFRGKGRYRIRVHYRGPDYEAWTPQHILVMVYPGRARPPVEYRSRPVDLRD
ncbi:hypothetical protein AB0O28_14900 [Microbispora sp. NPDC088329]|uniref:hypothetical protein n=1 Tax=Microbispora sp. NPDC088329 TaxID=3154869 RepID=UPI003437A0A6